MKKIMTLSIICLLAFTSQAQDKMIKEFNAIKAELNLSEEQDAKIKELIQTRRASLKKMKEAPQSIMSEEEVKKQKMEKIKSRKEVNMQFKQGLAETLNDEQRAKLKELIPEKNKKLMEEKEAKPMAPHKHKNGEEHTH